MVRRKRWRFRWHEREIRPMRTGRVLAGLISVVGLIAAMQMAGTASAADETKASDQVGLVRTGSGTFSLDVEGADIRTVMRAVGEFSGRNIVVGKDVKATRSEERRVG